MGRDVHEIRKMTADPNVKTNQLLGDILDKVTAHDDQLGPEPSA